LLDRISYTSLQWLVFACVLLHNIEEGIAARSYLPKVGAFLSGWVPAEVIGSLPTVEQFYGGLVGATLIPLALTAFATTGRPTRLKPYLVATIAAGLLLNVLLPHVPAAVALGGYAPGVVTALVLNLPVSLYFLRRSLREGRIDRRGLAIGAAIAFAFLVLGVPLLWFLTSS
jgi:hypothetical protein